EAAKRDDQSPTLRGAVRAPFVAHVHDLGFAVAGKRRGTGDAGGRVAGGTASDGVEHRIGYVRGGLDDLGGRGGGQAGGRRAAGGFRAAAGHLHQDEGEEHGEHDDGGHRGQQQPATAAFGRAL